LVVVVLVVAVAERPVLLGRLRVPELLVDMGFSMAGPVTVVVQEMVLGAAVEVAALVAEVAEAGQVVLVPTEDLADSAEAEMAAQALIPQFLGPFAVVAVAVVPAALP
jgi:hypothetical protein